MQLNKMYRIFHDIKFEIKRFGQQMMAFSKKVLNLLSNVVFWSRYFKQIFQKIPQP